MERGMDMAFDLSKKGKGFYAASLAAILCLVTAIYYQITYSGDQYYSSGVFFTLLAALPVAVVLFLLKGDGFVPAALAALSGVAALQFIYAMYWDISVVIVGIDKNSFDTRFIVVCALLAVSFVVSEISIYMKMRKAPAKA